MKPTLVADYVLTNGHVIDPANEIDGPAEVAVEGDRIVAVGGDLATLPRKRAIDLQRALVCPGLVDLHVHCYASLTPFGLRADHIGVHAGSTTIVDHASPGA